ncbi:MAG: hypothetical protein WC683_06530 [bacterium]
MAQDSTLKTIGETLASVLLAPLMVTGCSNVETYTPATEAPGDSKEDAAKKTEYNTLLKLKLQDERCESYYDEDIKPPTALSDPKEISVYEQCCIKYDYNFVSSFYYDSIFTCDCSLFSPKVEEACNKSRREQFAEREARRENACLCSNISAGSTSNSLLGLFLDSISDSVVESVKALF